MSVDGFVRGRDDKFAAADVCEMCVVREKEESWRQQLQHCEQV